MSGGARFIKGVKVSERHGSGEWLTERVTLALLIPLGLWTAWTAFSLVGAGYDTVLAWFSSRLNAGLLILALLVFIGYAGLAWKVIIEDYIHKLGTRSALLVAVNLVCLALAAAGVFFIVRLALGSAPLPAGLGF